jgi:hypothetical protein
LTRKVRGAIEKKGRPGSKGPEKFTRKVLAKAAARALYDAGAFHQEFTRDELKESNPQVWLMLCDFLKEEAGRGSDADWVFFRSPGVGWIAFGPDDRVFLLGWEEL